MTKTMSTSRTEHASRNIESGIINKIITSLLPFVTRTMILYILGEEFLGLNSLFSSILQVLNLAELGLSEAIVFSLYKPIEVNDTKKIKQLMSFYCKIYKIIGGVIFGAGCALMPFLPKLINGSYPSQINIYIVFFIFLLNSACSYWLFAYKSVLLVAHQRYSVVTNVTTWITIIQYICQITILFVARSYYCYIVLLPAFTIIRNIYTAKIVDKNYPQYKPEGKLPREDIKEICKSVSALMIGRFSDISRNSFDSIVISSFLGLIICARYNNYFFIYSMVYSLFSIITSSMQAGVGNSIVTETVEKNYQDFCFLTFIFSYLGALATSCLIVLYQPFITLWLGSESLLSDVDMILFCIYFFAISMTCARNLYMNGSALWWRGKLCFFWEAISNLILNIILGKIWGTTGILIATILTIIVFNYFGRNRIVFRYYFQDMKQKTYYKDVLVYVFTAIISCAIGYGVSIKISLANLVIRFLLLLVVALVVPNVMYLLFFRRTAYLKRGIATIKQIIKRK